MSASDLRPLTALMNPTLNDPDQIRWREIADRVLEKVNTHIAPLKMVYGTMEVKEADWERQAPPTRNDRLRMDPDVVLMSDRITPVRNRPGYVTLRVTDLPEWAETVEEAVTYKRMAGYARRLMSFMKVDSPYQYRFLLRHGGLRDYVDARATRMAKEIQSTHAQLMALDPPMNDWERMMKPAQLFHQAEMMTLERWCQPSRA